MKSLTTHLPFVALATFFPGLVSGRDWTQTSAPTKNWQALAISADGSKLLAAVYNGGIYTSTNFGGTWNSNSAPVASWQAVACSADATRMAAACAGGVYTSADGGATWNRTILPNYNWYSVSCSADGTLLAAVSPTGNSVYVSTNFGISWRTNAFPAGIYDGNCVGLSASGNALAAGNNIGIILVSTSLGLIWNTTNHFSGPFKSIAVSADGATLAAVYGGGTVYTSTNHGVSWSANNISSSGFNSIAASADGTSLVAVGGASSVVYAFSTNSGTSWTTNGQAGPAWRAVASSADGNCLAAAAYGGGIWLWRTIPSPHLDIAPFGAQAKISWTLPSTNFLLQQSANLYDWLSLTDSPTLNLLRLQDEVIVGPTNGQSFYRLATP